MTLSVVDGSFESLSKGRSFPSWEILFAASFSMSIDARSISSNVLEGLLSMKNE
jgi:hypothetical protein